jgi:uncharacterized membrane protein
MGRRWLLIGLFASVALNLFIVGGLVGAALSGVRLRPPPPEPRGRAPMAMVIRELPPEQQDAWREQGRAFAEANRPRFREARQLSRRAAERFGEQPFPRDAILADLKRARALEQETRVANDERVVSFAAGLPPEQRVVLSRALRPPGGSGRRGPRGPDGRGGPGLPDR